MNTSIPELSIAFMILAMICGTALPVALCIFFRKKYHCSLIPFFFGCAVMLTFALMLEQLAHALILNSSAGTVIKNNIWLYAVYGGLMAGLFEEGGRFIIMKTAMKNYRENNYNALMYGAGHGGFEAFYLLTLGMVNNLAASIMINSGNAAQLTAGLTADQAASAEAAFAQLASSPSWLFLLSIVERFAAIASQLAFSVLVWFAVKNGKKASWLFPAAIFLHLLLDAAAVILNHYLPNQAYLTELAVCLLSAGNVCFAYKIWKKSTAAEEV